MRVCVGIELGGTKVVVGAATVEGRLVERDELATTSPEETLGRVRALLDKYGAAHEIGAVGIGSFGPVTVAAGSRNYGRIGRSPKLAWRGFDLYAYFREHLALPIAVDTDVNAAALAEAWWGAGTGRGTLCYVTVGTGIGAGILIDGTPVHGLLHPEVGHMYPRRSPGDEFAGVCPSHGDCVEGLAAGPAIAARWGAELADLGAEHPAHEIIAGYLAQLLVNIVLTVSPEAIVLGGGVMSSGQLIGRVRRQVRAYLNDYITADELGHGIDAYIVPPKLGADAGVLGAAALAIHATRHDGSNAQAMPAAVRPQA